MKKAVIIVICILIGLYLTWWSFLQPLLSFAGYLSEPEEHIGVSFYEDETYLEFQHGEAFKEFLAEYPAPGTAVDFYHIDISVNDNPIYGKTHDTFMADFICSPEIYAEYKEMIIPKSTKTQRHEDFDFYPLPNQSTSWLYDRLYMVALCDQVCLIRFVMIADYLDIDPNTDYSPIEICIHSYRDIWTVPADPTNQTPTPTQQPAKGVIL